MKWMVDVKGGQGEAGLQDMQEVLNDLDFSEFIRKQGSLAATVQAVIEQEGYVITDRGGGRGCWHIGVPFDVLESAVSYLQFMTDRFASAIGCSLLRFELKTWSTSDWKKHDD